MRAIFSTVTMIRIHNLSLARTIPYHWATLSHMTNNEIFFFYHHFEMSYITHFTAIMMSNKNLFNYKVVDLVATYNIQIYFFFSIRGHLKILKIWNSKFNPCIFGAKTTSTEKNFNYKVIVMFETYNFTIDHFLNWDNLKFSKITCSSIIKITKVTRLDVARHLCYHEGDTLWWCPSLDLSKPVIYTNLICDVL